MGSGGTPYYILEQSIILTEKYFYQNFFESLDNKYYLQHNNKPVCILAPQH